MDNSKHWSDQLQKFKDLKRKSAHVEELVSLAESMVSKIDALKNENQTLKEKSAEEISQLNKQIKELRDELDAAWKY